MAAVVKVGWERCSFKPPTVWPLVKKQATESTDLDLPQIDRCVYVIRIAHTYCIEYRWRASPALYIGRGSFKQRITAHLDWINELGNMLRDLEIQVWFFTPRMKRTADAYKTVEADLIEEFVREMGSVPWFNTNRPNRVRDYIYEPRNKFRQAVLQGNGSHYPWAIKPNGNDDMRALYDKNFAAEPR